MERRSDVGSPEKDVRNRSPGRLIIICGLPGSGKTTVAKRLERNLGARRMSADDWMADAGLDPFDAAARARIEAHQWAVAKSLLSAGRCVAIEWGTWSKAERDHLRHEARLLGAAVYLHWCTVGDPGELWQRISARQQAGDERITRLMVEQWWLQFEVPEHAEMELYDQAKDLSW